MMRYFVQVAQQDELRRGLATAKEEAARAEADLVEARREIEVGVKFCKQDLKNLIHKHYRHVRMLCPLWGLVWSRRRKR